MEGRELSPDIDDTVVNNWGERGLAVNMHLPSLGAIQYLSSEAGNDAGVVDSAPLHVAPDGCRGAIPRDEIRERRRTSEGTGHLQASAQHAGGVVRYAGRVRWDHAQFSPGLVAHADAPIPTWLSSSLRFRSAICPSS